VVGVVLGRGLRFYCVQLAEHVSGLWTSIVRPLDNYHMAQPDLSLLTNNLVVHAPADGHADDPNSYQNAYSAFNDYQVSHSSSYRNTKTQSYENPNVGQNFDWVDINVWVVERVSNLSLDPAILASGHPGR
jgi:hypothetical protein